MLYPLPGVHATMVKLIKAKVFSEILFNYRSQVLPASVEAYTRLIKLSHFDDPDHYK
jgi:hypothetical protein